MKADFKFNEYENEIDITLSFEEARYMYGAMRDYLKGKEGSVSQLAVARLCDEFVRSLPQQIWSY